MEQGYLDALIVTAGIEIVIYCAFLGFVIYLINGFLIKLKFYREWHLTTFYAISVAIIMLRIFLLSLLIYIFYSGKGTTLM